MNQTATITHKRQFTIPVSVFRELGLQKGDKLLVTHQNGRILIEPMLRLVESLAGSVTKPARLKHIDDPDVLIKKARQQHFRSKK